MSNNKNDDRNVKKIKKINSLMIALLLTANFISMVLASTGLIVEGLLPIIFLISMMITIVSAYILMKRAVRIHKVTLFFSLGIFIFFFFTILIRGTDTYAMQYLIEFIAFGMIAFILVNYPYSSKKIILYTMYIGNIILVNPIGFIDSVSLNTQYARVNMGSSYAILPMVVATIIYILLIKSDQKFKLTNIITYICNGYLLYVLLTEGTRGAVLAIVLLFCFIFIVKINKNLNGRSNYLQPLIFSFLFIISILIVVNLDKILLDLNIFLQNVGVNSATIIKTITLVQNEGLTGALNNRDTVFKYAIQLILESPIFGNGIGAYADKYYGTYPHNLFLQILLEGGIILFLPFLIIITISIIIMSKTKNGLENYSYLILFLFILCIPRLMLSSYLWQNQAFWLYIFITLTVRKEYTLKK